MKNRIAKAFLFGLFILSPLFAGTGSESSSTMAQTAIDTLKGFGKGAVSISLLYPFTKIWGPRWHFGLCGAHTLSAIGVSKKCPLIMENTTERVAFALGSVAAFGFWYWYDARTQK